MCANAAIMLASADDVVLQGRNVLTVPDLSPVEIGAVLALAEHLKSSRMSDQLPLLRGKSTAMLFRETQPAHARNMSGGGEVAMVAIGRARSLRSGE